MSSAAEALPVILSAIRHLEMPIWPPSGGVFGVDIPEPLIVRILIHRNLGMILVQHVLKVAEKVGAQTLIIIHTAC